MPGGRGRAAPWTSAFLAVAIMAAVVSTFPSSALGKGLAERIVERWDAMLRGKASSGEMEMYIRRWNRRMRMKFWEIYPDFSLVRITSPAEDAGVASLKIGKDMWTYNPKIDQVQKIPPSLMLDAWMGSDFTNDDVARSSSVRLDYDTGEPVEASLDGKPTWRLPLVPKPESPVVWERLVVEVARDDLRPLRVEYYDEKGVMARRMSFSDYRKLADGRIYPFLWRMENLSDKGRYTDMRVIDVEFKESLPKRIFTLRNLKRGR